MNYEKEECIEMINHYQFQLDDWNENYLENDNPYGFESKEVLQSMIEHWEYNLILAEYDELLYSVTELENRWGNDTDDDSSYKKYIQATEDLQAYYDENSSILEKYM